MKKVLFLMLVCALGFSAFGQTISLRSADKVECVKSDMNGLKASFSFSSLDASTVETPRGELSEIHIEGTYPNGNVGEPQLPMFTRLIAIPTGATPVVSVGSHSETEYTLSDYGIGAVSAMQAPIRKSDEPSTLEYAFSEAAYARNSYNDDPIAMVEVLGTMRGITLGRLIVQPVRYNPVAGTVKVFNDIEVNVDFQNGDAESTEKMFKSTCSPAFISVYDQIFNIDMLMDGSTRDAYTDHPDMYNTPVKMLVICYSGFQGNAALNSWLQWKLQKGYYVDIYYTSETGTSASAIASFIKTKYNASVSAGNAYTYLIVIGDTGQIPQYMSKNIDSSVGNCASDLGYASVNFSSSTNNYFPDMYYSRMSVENTTHLTNYINKVLTYEKYEFTDGGNYLNNVILVGGWDSNWTARVAKPTINYATNYYFNSSNTTYGGFGSGTIRATVSTSSTQGYSGTNNGCYQGINNGVCFLNYTAHGDKQEWYQPKMTAAHVATLTNTGKYFFGVGNCCLTGNFNNTTTTYSPGSAIGTNACFAETMIRVPNAGAVAYVGCSPYSYWYEDFYWAVGAHSYSQGNYPSTTASSKGVYDVMFMDQYWNSASALNYVGNLAVQQAVSNGNTNSGITDGNTKNSAHYYFQFYHTFGDGSVMPYVTKPEANTVTIPSTVNAGANSITVNAVAGSYVAVTNNSSVIYGVGVANSSGVATVNFTNAIPNSGTLYVVVTRQQYQPYFGTVTVGGGGGSTTYYTVSASASPSNGGTVSGAGSYTSGATCTLTATPAAGYEFTKWTKNGTQVSTNATYSFTVSANASYVANFTEVSTPDPGTATEITIGSGSSSNAYLPTYAYYNYSLTEQIYTAAEIGQAGTITAVSFKVANSKSTTRNVDLYLKHTTKTAFTSKTGWETLSTSDKVFSGNVTFNASGWTTITLSTPFVYNGTSNLVVGMDDNTGSYVSSSSNSPKFYVYSSGGNRALRIYNDNTNYNPASPSSYSGSYVTSNDQIMFSMNASGGTPQVNTYTITVSANPTAGGTVTGAGTYDEGQTVTLTATANTGYTFSKWTKNGTQVSTNSTYSFTATANAAYVAVFTQNSYAITVSANPTAGGTVTGAGTYNYGSTATLTATANNGYTFTNWTKNGTQVSTNATYSFTVTGAASYVANFTQQQVTTYYDVTVAEVPNGTVTANKSTAASGETVTLSVTPNSGCTFYTWVVYKTGDVNTTVTVSNNKFTMPAYNVTVVAVIKPNGNSGTGSGAEITIGSGSSTNAYLPTYAYYNYSLTEQIYTATEIGQAGTITAISFKVGNSKSTTRNVDLYLKHTTKTAFTSKTGWETLSSGDKVYSGNVTFNASGWTTITLSTPFVYNGTSNLVVGMDDNTGSYVSSSNSPKFYVYSTSANRALRIYNDNTNYNPASPSSYNGSYVTSNNQILLTMAGGATTGSTEVLVVAPKNLNGFTYSVGNGPSAKQTFAVIGADLSSSITLTAPTGYEISSSLNGTYGTTLTLTGSRDGSKGTQTWGFEGTMDNWTTIDKDGDGYNWQLASVLMSGYNISAHGGSDMLSSESYNKTSGAALTPDNWLVSPQVTLGGSFSMYACAQDANYAAEHFGIYVSTGSATNTNSFVKLGEWTLTAKDMKTQGSWGQYTVDLSAYAGQTGYIAVRHFNCYDQFYLNVDDFTLTYDETPVTPPSTGAEFLKANVYIRLKSGLSAGNYNGTLNAATTGVSNTLTLSGTVTGSKSVMDEKQMSVFPNPVERGNRVTIQLPDAFNSAKVEVFNIIGALIWSGQYEGIIEMPFHSEMAPGTYTIKATDDQGNACYGKLIVE